jgi:hypothetical protein
MSKNGPHTPPRPEGFAASLRAALERLRRAGFFKVKVNEVVSAGLALVSIAVAGLALHSSQRTEDEQEEFQREIEERQSAPLLVPGVELGLRGKQITFGTESGQVTKYAHRLLTQEDPLLVVIPMRNAGEGVAILLFEFFQKVDDCITDPPRLLLERRVDLLGYYVVSPGDSEQLSYRPRDGEERRLFRELARAYPDLRLVLRYTDIHRRKLRWTCVVYHRATPGGGWSLRRPVYGEREMPAWARGG